MKNVHLKLVFVVFCILIYSCARHNPTANNEDEILRIISYESEKISNPNNPVEYSFLQQISWEVTERDVSMFSYRITTSDGELPDSIFTDADGWIYHYLPGADESIPLSSPLAERTIWTDETQFEISFISNNGVLSNILTYFEIRCLIYDEISEIIFWNYFESREIGTLLTNSGGNCNGGETGTALTFFLNEKLTDVFVEGLYADHFMYRLNIISELDSTMIFEGEWHNSNECEDIRKVTLNVNSIPPLIPNIDGEISQFEAYIVTRSGYADIDNPALSNFKVCEGFHPGSLIYIAEENNAGKNDTWVLGENHFVTLMDQSIPKVIPSIMTADGAHFATPFWIDWDGNMEVIGSDDLQIFFHWGWKGEFETDQPGRRRVGHVYDELTNTLYFAEILFFDLRYDDEAFVHESLPAAIYNIIDDDGTEWLRVPIEHEFGQNIIVSGDYVSVGTHSFVVRAVDSQFEVDPTPAEFIFNIVAPIPKEEKIGILIIDDEQNHNVYSPEDIVDSLYAYFFEDQSGVEEINRDDVEDGIGNLGLSALHFYRAVFSPTDLQQYKTILYHSDAPLINTTSNFDKEYDSLNLYLDSGGNLIFSGGANALVIQDRCQRECLPLLEKYFGIPLDTGAQGNAVNVVTYVDPDTGDETIAHFIHLQFLVKATASNGFTNDVYLQFPSFNQHVNMNYGLGPVAYFEYLINGTEPIFNFGCKYPDSNGNGIDPTFLIWDDEYDTDQYPNEAQYNEFNGKTVALRKITENNSCYFFGFPLSYMNAEQVKNTIIQILDEIE